MVSRDDKKAAARAKAKAADKADEVRYGPAGGMVWKVLSVGSTVVATKLATDAAQKGWKLATGKSVPVKGDFERERTRDVVLFTALSSMLVATARVAVERAAASYYRNSAGHLPKALEAEELSKKDKKAHAKLEKAMNKAKKGVDAITP